MNANLKKLDIGELRPRITIFGVGGTGGNAVNNMISAGLQGVDFVVADNGPRLGALPAHSDAGTGKMDGRAGPADCRR
jgi:cell division GTPase FtsZ